MNDGEMKAAVLQRFGDAEELVLQNISVPAIGSNDVLIQVDCAGLGEWDVFEREGGYAEMLGLESVFPYVLGSEGAGTVVAVGEKVSEFTIGDKVCGVGFLNAKGGFYAEYVALNSNYVSPLSDHLTLQKASSISGVGLTALRGLEDVLKIKQSESVMIFGASGGVGHLAVQLAKSMGARVFAVASGQDGVSMVKGLGIDVVIDGREDNLLLEAHSFAPEGFDAALFTAGGESTQKAIECVHKDGRIAFPNGIDPVPQVGTDIMSIGYNGDPDSEIIQRLNRYIDLNQITVNVDRSFSLEDCHEAHIKLNNHYLGKLCLKVR
ncbi:zinc-dependent alcohol dehydrogenase family protein [Virgibacillus siamensis]|uniref:Zinc-dependent alcohol dehydrogenase family protein n=1 Tax=Virgibacillus siamensis TaxID=480071 RepID=A0ABP3RNZ0_9BACI